MRSTKLILGSWQPIGRFMGYMGERRLGSLASFARDD
jgi:hypothetical protein